MDREREPGTQMEDGTHILEINLISAQGLKPPTANLRSMQAYALAWVDPSYKLRTRTDKVGSENPTWNDKFLFRVTKDFLSGETSAVSVEIYTAGYLLDHLIGTVRFLLSSNVSNLAGNGTPAFSAVQIRRPSGRFHGVLNIAAAVYESSDFTVLKGLRAVCFGDLVRVGSKRGRLKRVGSKRSDRSSGGDSCGGDSVEFDLSDGADSTTSSSSATSSTVLKELNGGVESIENKAGRKGDLKSSDGGGLLCGLTTVMQRKIHLSPCDQNFNVWAESVVKKR